MVVLLMPGAQIAEVEAGSIAQELGLESGDEIRSINNKPLKDLIQFQFEWADEEVALEVRKKSGEDEIYDIEKDYDEPLGVIFSTAIFDKMKLCRNRCLFCFVDQMPSNMRNTLYVKDDDYRLSFLQGSFITLTNVEKSDLDRIKREHLSPLYVSVHTTDPALREEILQNPKAGKIMEIFDDLAESEIEFHTQVVLCKGLNDGPYLERTFEDLSNNRGVLSLAIVPVGRTQFREGLPSLETFDREGARSIIKWLESKQKEVYKERKTSFVWLSDEFYLMAGWELPSYESYEDFVQLENGVGMTRLFWHQFSKQALPAELNKKKKVTIVTGVSGRYALAPVVERLNSIVNLEVDLVTITNTFFGTTVTVTGLLTGTCLLQGLKNIVPGSMVFFPQVMLNSLNGKFLDEMTPEEVGSKLGIELISVDVNPESLVRLISDD